ncbi:MAG: hypothetical protein HRF43_13475, partial [Phycisphaerae bacterium]
RAAQAAAAGGRARVKLVFTHVPSDGPIWPNIGFDFDKRKKELTEKLTAACPNIEFSPVTAMNADQARKILEAKDETDGYLVYMVGIWTGAGQVIGASGKPALFVDDLYGGSGEFLIAHAAARRAGQKVVGVSSSKFEDVAAAARAFETLKKTGNPDRFLAEARAAWKKSVPVTKGTVKKDVLKTQPPDKVLERLRKSTILVVGARNEALIKAIPETFGTQVRHVEFQELQGACDAADRAEAARWADRWIQAAEKVVEPTRDEIVNSAAMYLAELALLKKYDAQAISINCLGGFYGGHIRAYPCLGFTQLNNDGLVGACEADLVSTITMLALGYLTGRPSYISDPVMDTSKNQIIYAHCVAPTKVFGPDGATNPCHIRNHSEDRKGAVLRSLMPLEYMTTTVEFHPLRKEVVLHQGRTVENVDEDKACRTKLAVEVKGDIDKLFNLWDQWGWHRVTVYGDAKEPIADLAKALKMKVVEEA